MSDVIEDAIRINIAAMEREGITLIRDMESLPPIEMDRPKVLQILVNLLSNARHAVRENDDGHREIRLRLREVGDAEGRFMEIQVADNGVGIAPDHLPRVFAHGFTTRQDGHGFGLHSGAIAARSMGGRLIAESDGVSRGAAFTLIVPMELAGAYTS